MAAYKEIEIKFRVPDLRGLAKTLRRAKFWLATPRTHEMNTLYDLPNQALRRRGELLRLRQYGKDWKLTHKAKGTAGRHKSRTETETTLTDGAKMNAILATLGYRPRFRYEKFRAEWTDGKGHVVVDETPIGNFAEIEGAPRWIDRTAKLLGVQTGQYLTQSYLELFFRWKESTQSPAADMTFAAIRRAKKKP